MEIDTPFATNRVWRLTNSQLPLSVPRRLYALRRRAYCEVFLGLTTTLIVSPFKVKVFDLKVLKLFVRFMNRTKVTHSFFSFGSPFNLVTHFAVRGGR